MLRNIVLKVDEHGRLDPSRWTLLMTIEALAAQEQITPEEMLERLVRIGLTKGPYRLLERHAA